MQTRDTRRQTHPFFEALSHLCCLSYSVTNTFTAIVDDKEDDSAGFILRNTTQPKLLRVSPTSRCPPHMTGCSSVTWTHWLMLRERPWTLQSLTLPTFLPASLLLLVFITDSQTTTGTLSTVNN